MKRNFSQFENTDFLAFSLVKVGVLPIYMARKNVDLFHNNLLNNISIINKNGVKNSCEVNSTLLTKVMKRKIFEI